MWTHAYHIVRQNQSRLASAGASHCSIKSPGSKQREGLVLLHTAPGEMVHLRNVMSWKKAAAGKDVTPLLFSKRGSLSLVRNNHLLDHSIGDHRIIETWNGLGWKQPLKVI